MTTQVEYIGPERRIHKILVTRNTEYHIRKNHCVAVRDIRSGVWQYHHKALGSSLRGSFLSGQAGGYQFTEAFPKIGERICFSNDIFTSPIHTICRPERYIVETYKA